MRKLKEIPLRLPPPVEGVWRWLVMGLDPSMSRTGYALMHVSAPFDSLKGQPCPHPGCLSHVSHPCEGCGRVMGRIATAAEWVDVGSVKPEVSANPIWIRGKGMSLFLKERIVLAEQKVEHDLILSKYGCSPPIQSPPTYEGLGLLISMEYPTPMNDFLVALNRIIHLVFFEGAEWRRLQVIRIFTTNASTLRSLMGLFTKGRTNKKENILRAYDFIDKKEWPSLDPDSCDAVLLAMMGRYAASILLGRSDEVPSNFLNSLCSDVKLLKGKGRRQRTITAGIMHRPEYFYEYSEKQYVFCFRDASSGKVGLGRETYRI